MTNRLGATRLACTAAMLLALAPAIAGAAPSPATDLLSKRVMQLTRDTQWVAVAQIALPFRTFHPQGMVKIGDDFYLSSVEVVTLPKKLSPPRDGLDRDGGAGVGHLFKFGTDGALKADVRLGEGAIYHPGGIDFDGRSIWVPVSEYRPHSHAIMYTVDPTSMGVREAFRFDDHIGGVVYDRAKRRLHAINWGARQFYAWPPGFRGSPGHAPRPVRSSNPNQYIDFQDCHYAGAGRMLCSGVADYAAPHGEGRFQLGGIDLVDLKSGSPVWQLPIELRSPSGRVMTQNPFFIETTRFGLRAYFVPDDDTSTLFVFEANL